MTKVYFDWNVFNKIEKIETFDFPEKEIYKEIEELIMSGQIIVPYSNAHINDLHRGFLKNSDFTPKHLNTLSRLTTNLCLVQYWGEKNAIWHFRDPEDFFESVIDESTHVTESFSDLLRHEDDPSINSLVDLRNEVMRATPVPDNFKKIYSLNPIFDSMYPRTKIEMNMLALCEDLYTFNHRIKKDYALYKNYRKYLNDCKLKFPQLRKMLSESEKRFEKPTYLLWDDLWEDADKKVAIHNTSNEAYDKVVDLYLKTDLKGYKPDEKFANLVDDALHTFYASHCDFFITNDNRCLDKAIKIFQQLRIKTKVLNVADFLAYLKSNK